MPATPRRKKPVVKMVPLPEAVLRYRLLDTKQTAALLGVEVKTLSDWRIDNIGPTYTKVGHLVKYMVADLLDWLDGRRVVPGGGAARE